MSENLLVTASKLQSRKVSDQLAALQQIASQSDVKGVAIRCLELLDAPEEDVRTWAAEALTNSVAPTSEEATALVEILESTRKAGSPSISDDQIYWSATLLARLPTRPTTDAELLIDVANRTAQRNAHGVAERCLSSAQRLIEQNAPFDWSAESKQSLIHIRDAEASSARLKRLADQLIAR